VKNGDEIELICEGSDEKEALETLSRMIINGLEDEFIKK
jgi:phosphotransferase system HPr-like phosphotransfer protein